MKKRILTILILLISITLLYGQNKRKAFTMVKGDSLAIFLVNPLSANESYNVYKKTDSGFVLKTKKPISAVLDPLEARVILGDDWELVSKAVNNDNEVFVSRQIRANTFKGAILSLISYRAAKVSGRWFLDTDVKKNESITYKLVFKKSNRISDSLIVSAQVRTIVPKTPSGLKLTAGNREIKLEWEYHKWSGDYSDIGFKYNIYRKESKGAFKKVNESYIIRDDATTPEYDDLWLQEGINYSYRVTIVDPIGNESAPSNIKSILLKDKTPPTTVTNVAAEESKGKVSITWNMNPELDVKGFNVYRGAKLTGTFIKLTKKLVPFDVPFFVDSTITEKKQFFYTVSAVDTAGNIGKQSNPIATYLRDDFPPEPPSNLTYKIIDNKVQLNWEPSKSKDLLGYHIYKSSNATGMKSRITLKAIKETKYLDSGEKNQGFGYGGTFFYTLVAQDSSGNESDSLNLTIYVPDVEAPLPPTNFTANNKGDYVFIDCGMSPSPDADKYLLYKALFGKKDMKIGEFNKAPIHFVDTVATKGKSYIYSIAVIDTAGNISKVNAKDSIIFRDFSPPPAPRNIKARLQKGSVKLSWVKSIDFDMFGYNVYRSDYPTGEYKLLNKKPITEISYIDKSGNEKYFYRVRAVDTSGNESKYNETISVK